MSVRCSKQHSELSNDFQLNTTISNSFHHFSFSLFPPLVCRPQVFVPYYALDMVIMEAAYAIVKKATKDQNARFLPTNVKCPVVRHMDVASKANAIVNVAIKDTIARNVSSKKHKHTLTSWIRYTDTGV